MMDSHMGIQSMRRSGSLPASNRKPARRGARHWPCQTLPFLAAFIVPLIVLMLSAQAAWAAGVPFSRNAGITVTRAHSLGYSLKWSSTEPYAACGLPTPGHAACLSVVVPPAAAQHESLAAPLSSGSGVSPSYEGSGELGGFAPSELLSAYAQPSTGGSGQTVAIIDAYDDPNAHEDMEAYRSRYGLPPCTVSSGCFKKVNQKGEEYPYPENEPAEDWPLETSLDLDMVSAICSECHILLVEANNNLTSNLYAAEKEATKLGATEISNSWGGAENPEETTSDSNFSSSVPTTAATGDSGYGVDYPAASPNVIAVGGTTLKKTSNSRGWEESAWGGSGSGCSRYESKPSWQSDPSCPRRTVADTAAVADPSTPVSTYDSWEYAGTGKLGWLLVGGTSVAAPLVAGIEAHLTTFSKGVRAFYYSNLFDVTTGSDGACGESYLCLAGDGYDGPTGWGTPDGTLSKIGELQAKTEAATSIAATSAQLNGYVHSSEEAVYYFEYGPTTAYGSSAPATGGSTGGASSWKGVSQTVSSLHILKGTYHYRLVATNGRSTVYGQDRTFTTIPWSVQSSPRLSGAKEELLEGVSCVSTSFCMAAGSYFSPTEETRWAAIEKWTGSEWVPQTVEKPAGAKYMWLNGVSCTSTESCEAVGFWLPSSGAAISLAEHWNGSKWTSQSTYNEAEVRNELSSVSCAGSECMAVGNTRLTGQAIYTAFAERWTGSEWVRSAVKIPAGASESLLRGVSCTAGNECTAVGDYYDASGSKPFAERWNGTEWSLQSPPIPAGEELAELEGVSCVSAGECTAIGAAWRKSGESEITDIQGIIEHRSGSESEWSVQSAPAPSGARWVLLHGISCVSASECEATGSYGGQYGGTDGLSERLSGSEWSLELAARPEEPAGFEYAPLRGVSCLASTNCYAVGGHTESEGGKLGYEVALAETRTALKPYALTKQASGVGQSTATLDGTVNPEGAETKYYFEYGPTTSYGSKTAEASAGSGSTDVEVSKALTGLAVGTYHYRLVATSSRGTTDGADQTLATFLTEGPAFQPAKGTGAFPVALTLAGGEVKFRSEASTITCSSIAGSGQLLGLKEARLSESLTECKNLGGASCKNTAKSGEVALQELKGTPAYTLPSVATPEGREVGVVLSPASGEKIAEFMCGIAKVTVKGSLIAVVSPTKSRTKALKLAVGQRLLTQQPSEYETEGGGKAAADITCTQGAGSAEKCVQEGTAGSLTLTAEEVTIEA